MKVLVDTNVVLDVLLNRSPFSAHSKAIFDFAEQKRIIGYISASAITDIFYITNKKFKDNERVYMLVEKLTSLFLIATVSDITIVNALSLRWNDFEDSVQFVVGEGLSVDYIVTRNTQDFSSGNIPTVTPEQFLQIIITEEPHTESHGV
jgi:predicted nucleic acid-binding protein